jgi:hypothetical protein
LKISVFSTGYLEVFNNYSMAFLMCVVPVCPVRKDSSHKSEQVSQLLFGEVAETLETGKEFVRVRCVHDDYEGWCQQSQLTEIDDEMALAPASVACEYLNVVHCNATPMHIPFASRIGFFNKKMFALPRFTFLYAGEFIEPGSIEFIPTEIERIAMLFLHTPYLWGGRSVFGIDCSGFTQTVFSYFNIKLQRDAYQQATQGDAIGFLQEVQTGDLAFFDTEEGRINHVGLLLNQNTIIHSSGKVRIDTIDHAGIVNRETGQRTHQLRIIKRIKAVEI